MKNNIDEIVRILGKTYPDAGIALEFESVFQLLIAVILSAQCTDGQVNKVTPVLFEKYPDAMSMAVADIADVKKIIYSTGFFNSKAKNIIGASRKIVNDFDGNVPESLESLITLPGVARKTANVVLSEGFGKVVGVVVDTHVIRLSGKLKLAPEKYIKVKNAVQIEKSLMKKVDKKHWRKLSTLMIWHGRNICIARKPKCNKCPINHLCPSAEI